MKFDVVTAFPRMLEGPLGYSIIRRARERGLIEIRLHDLRDYARDKHRKVDDTPYGGGGGMVLMPGPLFAAVHDITRRFPEQRTRTVLLCPQGTRFDQGQVLRLSGYDRLILLCGHYEGVDERVREHLADESISIGDYVLTGGEIPATVLVDALTRLIPGALGDEDAARNDSFYDGRFDHPQYTRPFDFRGWSVPEVLVSGNHAAIDAWRRDRALERTARVRPDLLRDETTESDH
ncbi:MAG: tRNA (guanosine(37)-N1)-methyltransferase TrmD [Acidobacteria bacterium]|nr:tRNA (guanosine(37)-N1)-methyltransferase TrmD [Acidobacteriota bacterium]